VSVSKRSINQAGDLLREWWKDRGDIGPEETELAIKPLQAAFLSAG